MAWHDFNILVIGFIVQGIWINFLLPNTQCLKITEIFPFNTASEASYVYILSGQKLIKNAKKMVNFGDFWEMRLFWWFSTTVILQQNEIYGRAWLLYVKTQKVVILPPFTYHEEYWLKKSDGTSILYHITVSENHMKSLKSLLLLHKCEKTFHFEFHFHFWPRM